MRIRRAILHCRCVVTPIVRWRVSPLCVHSTQITTEPLDMNKILAGALAGFAATGPMTAAMILMHRKLPLHERYPLPPRRITMNFADMLDVKHEMTETQRTAATVAAHFGY